MKKHTIINFYHKLFLYYSPPIFYDFYDIYQAILSYFETSIFI